MKIVVNNEDFESVVICALRYCLGRRTYMPSIVIGFASEYITKFSNKALYVIQKDIKTEIQSKNITGYDTLGDPKIDEPLWLDFLNKVRQERELRELNEHN